MKLKTEFLTNYMKENRLTKADFCTECGISINSLNSIYKQNTRVSVIVVLKICLKLKIKFTELIYED